MRTNRESLRGQRQARGAVVVLLAVLVLVLLGLIALVVDTGIQAGSSSELQRSTQNAALSAMSNYILDIKAGKPLTTAASNALTRAQTILGINRLAGQAFRENPNSTTYKLGSGTVSDNGIIQFGSYILRRPSVGADVCGDQQLPYPCFVPSGGQATAIRIAATLKTNPLKTIFGRILGAKYLPLETSAIATLIPQNYAFLIDLSFSIAGNNHLMFGQINPAGTVPPSLCSTYPNNCSCDVSLDWWKTSNCRVPRTGAHFAYRINPAQNDCVDPDGDGMFDCPCLNLPYNGSPPYPGYSIRTVSGSIERKFEALCRSGSQHLLR